MIVPTIDGREHWLEKSLEAFEKYASADHQMEFIIIHNQRTCGKAWNQGLRKAKGDYILLSADDIEPTHGWAEAGISWIETHYSLPCARVLNTDGSLQSCGPDAYEHETGSHSDVARVPFFPAHLVDVIYPIIDQHYMTDYWVTHQAAKVGWFTQVVRDFCFIHHMAQEGRLDTLQWDIVTYYEAI